MNFTRPAVGTGDTSQNSLLFQTSQDCRADSLLSRLGVVSNAHSTLERRYRNGFGLHGMDLVAIYAIYPRAGLFR